MRGPAFLFLTLYEYLHPLRSLLLIQCMHIVLLTLVLFTVVTLMAVTDLYSLI